jgi:hypothetical protein
MTSPDPGGDVFANVWWLYPFLNPHCFVGEILVRSQFRPLKSLKYRIWHIYMFLIICVDFAHDISFFVGLDSLFLVTANLVTNDTHTQERLRSVNCNDGNFCQTKQKGLILSCTPCSTTCEAEGLPLGASTHNRLSQLAEWIPSIERAALRKASVGRSFMLAHPNMLLHFACERLLSSSQTQGIAA